MFVKKASFGYIVWLLPEEEHSLEVIEEIEQLKKTDKVAVLVSGNESAAEVLKKVIRNRLN